MHGLNTLRRINNEATARQLAERRPARPASEIIAEQQMQHHMHAGGFAAGRREGLILALGTIQRHLHSARSQQAHYSASALAEVEDDVQRLLAKAMPSLGEIA